MMRKWFFLTLMLLLGNLAAHAATTYVQGVSDDNNTPVTQAFAANVAAGDFLVLIASPTNTTGTAYTLGVSDNQNGAWTNSGMSCFDAYNTQANVFYVANAKAGATTVTITSSTANDLYYLLAEYSGIATSSPFDVAPTCTTYGSGTSFLTPSITTTNASDAILAATAINGNAGTITVASPFTIRLSASGENSLADDIVSATGSYQAHFTLQYGNAGAAVILALKQPGAPPTGSPATQVGAFAVGP